MRCVLFTDTWELECCGPELAPGSVLHLTLTAIRAPAMAAALGRPDVPDHEAVVWRGPIPDVADRADFVLYGSRHGPDEGPRVRARVEEIWEVRNDSEPDPDRPSSGHRDRPGRYRRVSRDRVPARLACDLADGADWPSSATTAIALSVRCR